MVKRTSGDECMVLRRGIGGHLHVLGLTITDASEIVGWLWPQELKDGNEWRT